MDAELLRAVAVVDIDPSQAEAWFELVNEAYTASNDDWDTFSGQLRASAGAYDPAPEVFLQHAADHGRIELISRLVADLRELPSAYASSKASAGQSGAHGDSVSWDAVVQHFGAGWANWDGSEAGWAQFRDWTYTGANDQSPELYALVYERLSPLDQHPLAERIAKLTEFGFTINTSTTPTEPAQPSGSQWDTVVQQFGGGWANWDGSEAGWAQFRDWTYTSANAQNPDLYAAAYEKLNPLNDVALAERIAKLTEFGFAVHAQAPSAAQAAEAISPEELNETIERAVAEVLKEVPGAENLTAEEVAEIHAEIRAEIEREVAS